MVPGSVPEAFTNPVIPGFHPDPSVCRVGGDYYLVTSSFTWFPGVPIFHSTDLVNWSQLGNVLDRPTQLALEGTESWASLGVFAPTIRYHDDVFRMITTNYAGGGNFFVTADDPAGPWSDPVLVDIEGIDPDLAWDESGGCWVHYSGAGGIVRVRIDDVTGDVLEGPEVAWAGTGLQYPEAPHLYRHRDAWYLMIAEGGTERGHAETVARSSSPVGPWEPCPANPILTKRSTDSPIQNTGHADLIQAPDGGWWMVLLGVRPRGMTPGFHVLGRETFLAPVAWVDGWPVVGELSLGHGSGVATSVEWTGRDDFDEAVLHPRWISARRPPASMASLVAGSLVLHGADATLDSPWPVLVGRRQQHHHCRARALVDPGSAIEAGLTLYMDDGAHYEIGIRGDQVIVRGRSAPFEQVVATAPCGHGPLVLEIETVHHPYGPDAVRLGIEDEVLAELDGRHLSTEVRTGFVGRVVGMYAVGGDAAFDWFDYEEVIP
jgi:xylan 1,4-beta-xylosidase